MINNKVIENELNDLEHEIADLLAKITELKREVSEMINRDTNLSKMKKIPYEQYTTVLNKSTQFYVIQTQHNRNIVINRCNRYKYVFPSECERIQLAVGTRKIIETYIPSQKLLLVVEL